MHASRRFRLLWSLSLLVLLACSDTRDKDVETDSAAELPSTASPYERDARAGCSYDLSWDEGSDGSAQWWSTTVWDPRVDDEGGEYITSYLYETEAGDNLVETTTYDDRLCTLSALEQQSIDGDDSGSRSTSLCDAHGLNTSTVVEAWDGESWSDDSTVTYTNSYDDDGRLTERVQTVVYADEIRATQQMRTVLRYDGDQVERLDTYFGDGEEEQLYYTAGYFYGEDDWVKAITVELGAYFGSSAGTMYAVTEYTWDERGNMLTRDYENIYSGGDDEHGVLTWDEHDRLTSLETWSDADGVHTLTSAIWDETAYRYTSMQYDDLLDPSQSYEEVYSYDGPWPWAGTATRDYVEDTLTDGVFSFAYVCD